MAKGRFEAGDVCAQERCKEFAGKRHQGQGEYRARRQIQKFQAQMQTRGREEQRNKEALSGPPHSRHDVTPHLVGERGEGGAKEQRSERAMESHLFGAYDHEEESAQQHAERELRHSQKTMQQDNDLRKHLGRHQPRNQREAENLSDESQYADRAQSCALFARGEVLTYGKPHHEQSNQLWR